MVSFIAFIALPQIDKDIRNPFLLERPSLQSAISSWRTDFELQEIFRKGKRQPLSLFVSGFPFTTYSGYKMPEFCDIKQIRPR